MEVQKQNSIQVLCKSNLNPSNFTINPKRRGHGSSVGFGMEVEDSI
ncbi:hypothetical protein OROMI_031368 [Orobanche minor]